jgi:hypothetical protein
LAWGFQLVFALVNLRWQWHQLRPSLLGVANAMALRVQLRRRNLYDTDPPTSADVPECDPRWRTARHPEGRFNALRDPEMGSAGRRFGRNVPLEDAWPEPESTITSPSPRMISNRLMARAEFIPAMKLNLLAAAWIQFQVHDWATHTLPRPPYPDGAWRIPLEPDDPWRHGCSVGHPAPRCPMLIPRTRRDEPQSEAERCLPPLYANVYTRPGLEWIERMTMTEVLLRNYPTLRSALDGADNPFRPWRRI